MEIYLNILENELNLNKRSLKVDFSNITDITILNKDDIIEIDYIPYRYLSKKVTYFNTENNRNIKRNEIRTIYLNVIMI